MSNWRDNWIIFLPNSDAENEFDLLTLLGAEGILPHQPLSYGRVGSILYSMGLDTTKCQVFHRTNYVGETVTEVQTYIYTMKRIYGEPI